MADAVDARVIGNTGISNNFSDVKAVTFIENSRALVAIIDVGKEGILSMINDLFYKGLLANYNTFLTTINNERQ